MPDALLDTNLSMCADSGPTLGVHWLVITLSLLGSEKLSN